MHVYGDESSDSDEEFIIPMQHVCVCNGPAGAQYLKNLTPKRELHTFMRSWYGESRSIRTPSSITERKLSIPSCCC
jgi:hypothetical protein